MIKSIEVTEAVEVKELLTLNLVLQPTIVLNAVSLVNCMDDNSLQRFIDKIKKEIEGKVLSKSVVTVVSVEIYRPPNESARRSGAAEVDMQFPVADGTQLVKIKSFVIRFPVDVLPNRFETKPYVVVVGVCATLHFTVIKQVDTSKLLIGELVDWLLDGKSGTQMQELGM